MGQKNDIAALSDQEAAVAREIHHRIKNNLQVVASVINLYARGISDPQALIAFRQIQVRVDALALIQRLVERSATGQTVDIQALLSQLTDQIRGLAHASRRDFEIALHVDACELPADVATPLALFAVEALSFGLFEEGGASRDSALRFTTPDQHHVEMRIDNPDFATRSLQGGAPSPAKLLAALADQLRGAWHLEDQTKAGSSLVLRMAVASCGDA